MKNLEQGLQDDALNDSINLFERANQVAANAGLDGLLAGALRLFSDVCRAKSGLFFIYQALNDHLHCRASFGDLPEQDYLHAQPLPHSGLGWQSLEQKQPILHTLSAGEAWQPDLDSLRDLPQVNILAVPFLAGETPAGALLLFDCQSPQLEQVHQLSARLANDIHRAVRLEDAEHLARRMQTMVAIFEQIGSTLDRDQLLHTMIEWPARRSTRGLLAVPGRPRPARTSCTCQQPRPGISVEQVRVSAKASMAVSSTAARMCSCPT
jgi:hypothetical protein